MTQNITENDCLRFCYRDCRQFNFSNNSETEGCFRANLLCRCLHLDAYGGELSAAWALGVVLFFMSMIALCGCCLIVVRAPPRNFRYRPVGFVETTYFDAHRNRNSDPFNSRFSYSSNQENLELNTRNPDGNIYSTSHNLGMAQHAHLSFSDQNYSQHVELVDPKPPYSPAVR